MEELVEVMIDILVELREINENIRDGFKETQAVIEKLSETTESALEKIQGSGIYNSISDIHDQIEESVSDIKGGGAFNTLSDIYEKLSDLSWDVKLSH
ncbi:MAG: hypothetical protein FWF03_07600 [Defluviitaleaceae bacterium]|nr:hypothetical protein [Defluviitaleaceae bacterium]